MSYQPPPGPPTQPPPIPGNRPISPYPATNPPPAPYQPSYAPGQQQPYAYPPTFPQDPNLQQQASPFPPQGQYYASPPFPTTLQSYSAYLPQQPQSSYSPYPAPFTAAPSYPLGYPPPAAAQPYPYQTQSQEPTWYLSTLIPYPFAAGNLSGTLNGYDPSADAEAIRKATKGFGTNDAMLISTLVPLSAMRMSAVSQAFVAKYGKDMVDVLDSETSSWFKMGIHGLAVGPLMWDVELLNQAISGPGTNEALLTEILLGRSNADLNLLKAAYRYKFNRDLIPDVKGDLSAKTERMFLMALSATRPDDAIPVNPAQVAKDVEALYKAGQGKIGTDEMVFCDVLINRSQPHLTAVIGEYGKKYKSLTKVIKSEFSGHMRAGLLHIVAGAKPKRDPKGIWRDAKLIDKAMVGFGTKDKELVWRLVRAHWETGRMDAIRESYKRRTGKTLEARVASETSGSYKKLVVALVNASGGVHK